MTAAEKGLGPARREGRGVSGTQLVFTGSTQDSLQECDLGQVLIEGEISHPEKIIWRVFLKAQSSLERD